MYKIETQRSMGIERKRGTSCQSLEELHEKVPLSLQVGKEEKQKSRASKSRKRRG
jgi:hypothetical protein